MDEAALIQDALHGDLDAFNRLVLAYQQMAFNLAYRMLNDDSAAEDATQTAFISAYRNLRQYRGGSFRAWVMRMVTNACYDELRRRQRRPTVALEPVHQEDDEEIESPAWLADHNPQPDEEVETRELEEAIQHCIQDLPEEFRAIGKPLGTIKSRLARARLRLRDCLSGFAELLPAKFRLGKEAELQ